MMLGQVVVWNEQDDMNRDFTQLAWSPQVEEDCRRIVRLAVFEDLDRGYDWTTVALVPEGASAVADVVARQAGVIAGLEAARVALDEMDIPGEWLPRVSDGHQVAAGTVVATISGSARDLLTSERTLLNLIGRMSGIATLTRRYVDAIAGTKARIYDTRKTTPGWRRLEKYSVHCGGGRNHRLGLFDAVLIKDNHLALGRQADLAQGYTPAQAVQQARQFVSESLAGDPRAAEMIVEVEVDSLEHLTQVLPAGPDIVLLDNMTPAMLREAVVLRDAAGSSAELEASGGVNLETIRAIAQSGVDRISVGALTHSATSLDVALDWRN
jgi:nicotinate-nucleotide pyrophosphorylase (carboxylating)